MSSQQTLTGETLPNDHDRLRPTTMLYCTDCDEYVLRSEQFDHPHDTLVERDEHPNPDDEGLPEECRINTKTWRVEYTVTAVETVHVEASTKGEAREIADEVRTYDFEYLDTMHTDVDGYFSDYSQASTDYLERVGLLPTDWSENGGDDE